MMNNMASNKSFNSNENTYISIVRKIDELNLQNQRLISIAEHMMKTSFMGVVPSQTPIIIKQIQQDMRASFNALVEGVQQYFIHIDKNLKQIVLSIQNQIMAKKSSSQKCQNPQFQSLINRIEYLEGSLKKTQQNQTKLINIIEGMAHRQLGEQTTINRSRQAYHQLNSSNPHESSFRIFSGKEQSSLPQLYPRPYVVDTINSEPTSRPHPPSAFCFPHHNNYSLKSIPMPKRSLKGQKQMECQSVNQTHRMSYMMNLLKS